MIRLTLAAVLILGGIASSAEPDSRNPFFRYLTSDPSPRLVTYTPSELDPRNEANQRRLATSSIEADLKALRPIFDGLVLYGYHEACTPRILAVARALRFRAVVLGVWDIKSAAELDGVAESVRLHAKDFVLAVLVGNEGITFKRYESIDLTVAAERLRKKLPADVPLGTCEPLVGYQNEAVRTFGDFLAPNIHPVFDRPALAPSESATWVRQEAEKLAATGKPVIVKETGFPHAGMLNYTPQTQRAFWEAYLAPGIVSRSAERPGAWRFHGVAFEAFDLPWKSQESKLDIEKSWGLFSPTRQAHPAVTAWSPSRP